MQEKGDKRRGDLEEDLIHFVENAMTAVQEAQFGCCPGCNRRVEKMSGCDHMTCTCGTEFTYKHPDYASMERLATAAAVKAETEWRKKHPTYKGTPLNLRALTKKHLKQ
jgi:hypothetical protein